MSVGTVLTLGYGSFGTVNFVPTLGYGDYGTAPQPTSTPRGVRRGRKRDLIVRISEIDDRQTTAEFLKAQLRIRHPDSAFTPEPATQVSAKQTLAEDSRKSKLAAEAMRAMKIEAENEERRILDDTEIILKLLILSST